MTSRIRIAPGEIRAVNTRVPGCPAFSCFWMARHLTRSGGGSSYSARLSNVWECAAREQGMCCSDPVVADPPRYRLVRGAWETVK